MKGGYLLRNQIWEDTLPKNIDGPCKSSAYRGFDLTESTRVILSNSSVTAQSKLFDYARILGMNALFARKQTRIRTIGGGDASSNSRPEADWSYVETAWRPNRCGSGIAQNSPYKHDRASDCRLDTPAVSTKKY